MISMDSDLYRAHPDWALTDPGRKPMISRKQLVLDLGRKEVRDWLFETIAGILRETRIEYIKWDYNRQLSDVFSHRKDARSGEFFHRFILGLYEIWNALTEKFPEILFESCSSGGNRFDLGSFCYMPQCWTSDDTDALERIKQKVQELYSTISTDVEVSNIADAIKELDKQLDTTFSDMADSWASALMDMEGTAEDWAQSVGKMIAEKIIKSMVIPTMLQPLLNDMQKAWNAAAEQEGATYQTMLDAMMPLPSDETTPPVTKMYLVSTSLLIII
jgi:hypothetical protein